MNKDNYIKKLINSIEFFPEFYLFFGTLPDTQQEKFLSFIESLKIGKLYPGFIHGKYHSEKVCLYTFILGIELGLSEDEMKIVCDAALYHDFKRQGDYEDSLHGLAAANNIDEIVYGDPFYQEPLNKSLLSGLIDNHSARDGRTDKVQEMTYYFHDLDVYQYDMERFGELCHVLMDADALDRARFSKASLASLDPEFLHYDFSKDLIPLAEEVNIAYKRFDLDKKVEFSELLQHTGAVCHSAGFVFSRIPYILKYGLLSAGEQQRRNIMTHRNFDGGNTMRWISVVPVSLIQEGNTTNAAFLDNGIVIRTIEDQTYYESEYDMSRYSIADAKGLPYIKGGHKEERFVFETVPIENISELYVSKKCANKDLSELQYIFPNLDYLAYRKMLDELLREYKAPIDYSKKIDVLYEKFVEMVKEYGKLSKSERNNFYDIYAQKFSSINMAINKILAVIIKRNYTERLGLNHSVIKKITPVMILEDQLLSLGIPYQRMDMGDRISFQIRLKKEKSEELGIGSK